MENILGSVREEADSIVTKKFDSMVVSREQGETLSVENQLEVDALLDFSISVNYTVWLDDLYECVFNVTIFSSLVCQESCTLYGPVIDTFVWRHATRKLGNGTP